MRASPPEYLSLKLRAHELLRGVPLYDVTVVDLPGGGAGRSIADIRALESAAAPSRVASALYGLRFFLGRVFGWDRVQMRPEDSLLPRLSERDRRDSEIVPVPLTQRYLETVMNLRWASLGALGLGLLILHCEGGLLVDSVPTMNGQWTGSNRRYQLIYNGVTLTQGRADTSFSGTGTWENPLSSGSLHVTGVLARGTVRMTLRYDSSATARFASYTAVLSSDLTQVSGLEVFGADSTDSLFLQKCTNCETVFPSFARSAGVSERTGAQ